MSFYGNITNTNSGPFIFDRIYSNRSEMDQALKSGKDDIFAGRFVLVDYNKDFSNSEYYEAFLKPSDISNFAEGSEISTTQGFTLYQEPWCEYPVIKRQNLGDLTNAYIGTIFYVKYCTIKEYYILHSRLEVTGQQNMFIASPTKTKYFITDQSTKSTFYIEEDFDLDFIKNNAVEKENIIGDAYTVVSEIDESTGGYLYFRCSGFNEESDNNEAIFNYIGRMADNPKGGSLENYRANARMDRVYKERQQGYNSTVWQKVYVGENAQYILIADLSAKAPEIIISEDAPSASPTSPHIGSDSSEDLLDLHLQPSWGMRVASADGKWSTDTATYNSDVKGVWKTFVQNENGEVIPYYYRSDGTWSTEPSEIDAAIYFNKDGFKVDERNYDEDGEDFITVQPTGYGTEYSNGNIIKKSYNTKEDVTIDENGDVIIDSSEEVVPDTQEVIIQLPGIGNAVSEVYDALYGEDRLGTSKDIPDEYKGYVNWEGLDGSEPERLGHRFVVEKEDGNGWENDIESIKTVVGSINSVHDLMGMIIVDVDDIDAEGVELDSDHIYYNRKNGKYYRMMNEWYLSPVSLEEIESGTLVKEFGVYQTDRNTQRKYIFGLFTQIEDSQDAEGYVQTEQAEYDASKTYYTIDANKVLDESLIYPEGYYYYETLLNDNGSDSGLDVFVPFAPYDETTDASNMFLYPYYNMDNALTLIEDDASGRGIEIYFPGKYYYQDPNNSEDFILDTGAFDSTREYRKIVVLNEGDPGYDELIAQNPELAGAPINSYPTVTLLDNSSENKYYELNSETGVYQRVFITEENHNLTHHFYKLNEEKIVKIEIPDYYVKTINKNSLGNDEITYTKLNQNTIYDLKDLDIYILNITKIDLFYEYKSNGSMSVRDVTIRMKAFLIDLLVEGLTSFTYEELQEKSYLELLDLYYKNRDSLDMYLYGKNFDEGAVQEELSYYTYAELEELGQLGQTKEVEYDLVVVTLWRSTTNAQPEPNKLYRGSADLYFCDVANSDYYSLMEGALFSPEIHGSASEVYYYGGKLGLMQQKETPVLMEGFARDYNTIHGLILKLRNVIDSENQYSRDINTVRGALNKLNDMITLMFEDYGLGNVERLRAAYETAAEGLTDIYNLKRDIKNARADLGSPEDTSSKNTIFGKIALLKEQWTNIQLSALDEISKLKQVDSSILKRVGDLETASKAHALSKDVTSDIKKANDTLKTELQSWVKAQGYSTGGGGGGTTPIVQTLSATAIPDTSFETATSTKYFDETNGKIKLLSNNSYYIPLGGSKKLVIINLALSFKMKTTIDASALNKNISGFVRFTSSTYAPPKNIAVSVSSNAASYLLNGEMLAEYEPASTVEKKGKKYGAVVLDKVNSVKWESGMRYNPRISAVYIV